MYLPVEIILNTHCLPRPAEDHVFTDEAERLGSVVLISRRRTEDIDRPRLGDGLVAVKDAAEPALVGCRRWSGRKLALGLAGAREAGEPVLEAERDGRLKRGENDACALSCADAELLAGKQERLDDLRWERNRGG